MTVPTKADLEILAQAEELDRKRRVRVDLVNAHGLELLGALKEMLEVYAPHVEQTVAESGEEALHPTVYKARKLIRKLEYEKI